VSDEGLRHPVTRGLAGFDGDDGKPAWGRWFRVVGARATGGQTLMTDSDGRPLLVLSRVDKGRVGLLLSDQMWLWARGYNGGGPYLDLLRRLAHWLMKEPELEEEALRARSKGREVTVERQSVSGQERETDLVAPDGTKTKLTMTPVAPGLSRAHVAVNRFGLYRAEDGAHVALVNVGPENALETRDVVSTTKKLRPIAEATGGGVRRLAAGPGDGVDVPRVVSLNPSPSYSGSDYIGIKRTRSSELIGSRSTSLASGFFGLALLLGMTVAAWLAEGGGLRRNRQ
jgi:hypothetical protein